MARALWTYFDEALEMMLPPGALVAEHARLFMRRDRGVVDDDGTEYKRMMLCGAVLDDLLLPGAREEQMVDGKLIIIPRGVWTSTHFESSPAAGMRSDQILAGNVVFHPENWDKRLR